MINEFAILLNGKLGECMRLSRFYTNGLMRLWIIFGLLIAFVHISWAQSPPPYPINGWRADLEGYSYVADTREEACDAVVRDRNLYSDTPERRKAGSASRYFGILNYYYTVFPWGDTCEPDSWWWCVYCTPEGWRKNIHNGVITVYGVTVIDRYSDKPEYCGENVLSVTKSPGGFGNPIFPATSTKREAIVIGGLSGLSYGATYDTKRKISSNVAHGWLAGNLVPPSLGLLWEISFQKRLFFQNLVIASSVQAYRGAGYEVSFLKSGADYKPPD